MDKVQFVIDSGATQCQLVFDAKSPLILQGDPDHPADTIWVYPKGKKNGLYVVSPKTHIPTGQWCRYWFHIIGNPDCPQHPDSCMSGSPPTAGEMYPCWYKGAKMMQIGPGMDVSE